MRHSHWAAQSAVTDPGRAGTAIDELPADLAALRQASSQLVFHYRAGGDYANNGVPAERVSEIDTRYADSMFGLVLKRGEPELARDRRPADRLVGCCRDATVFFLALARHKGIPARARVGFAAYLAKGWLIDHEIAEVWDERDSRWRLVDPEMDTAWTPEVNGRRIDWLDVTADQFVTGPRAWRAVRAGTSDPERHVVAPDLGDPMTRGWPYIAHHAIHDLAALNKTETLLWDAWGMQLGWHGVKTVPDADAAVLDEISAVTADPDCEPGVIAGLGGRDGLRIPPVVTSFDVNGGPPRQVDVSRALRRLSGYVRIPLGTAGDELHQQAVVPALSVGVALGAPHHANLRETSLLVSPDRRGIADGRIDGDPVVTAVFDHVAHDEAHCLGADAPPVYRRIEKHIDSGVAVLWLGLLRELDEARDLAIHLHGQPSGLGLFPGEALGRRIPPSHDLWRTVDSQQLRFIPAPQ